MENDEVTLTEKKKAKRTTMIFGIVLVCFFIIGIVVGLVLWYTKERPAPKVEPTVPPKLYRSTPTVSCHFKENVTQQMCEDKGCVWKELSEVGAPSCHFGPGYGYRLTDEPTETLMGYNFTLTRINKPTLYDNDIENVQLTLEFHGKSSVRLKFSDKDESRFEIPDEALSINTPAQAVPDGDRVYDVTWSNDTEFGIAIFRRDTGAVVFDTRVPGMVFSDQFLQITTKLPSGNVYGFGEHNHRRLHHDMQWKRWSIFTRDVAPVDEWNLYGAQTFYMNLEKDGKANGVFLKNSNAMDIILQPDPHPAVTYRVIGGVLDFYVFLGDSPDNVVQLYTKAVGFPLMPPYWSLGFQLSRWDYGNLSVVREVVQRNRDANIPQDVQFGDIDYMFEKVDFTYDRVAYAGLPEFIDELHSNGQRYIVILDHALAANETLLTDAKSNSPGFDAYKDGLDMDIFVKAPNKSTPLFAEVWPGRAVYPDFTNNDTQAWWTKWCRFLRVNENIAFDGLWLDMNEPSSFIPGSVEGCVRNRWNYPPYVPKVLGAQEDGKLFDKTICMDAQQAMGLHYNVHSLYGHTMAMQNYQTLKDIFPSSRPFAMTRSNFAGTQKYAIHWLGDNQSRWEQMPWSIIAMLEYSIFGFSMTGSDVCGFWYATDEEMCTRWTQLGAFYPYSRNHNAMGFRAQDPASFSDKMVRSSRSILQTRYKFLPFLYTLLYHAHTQGSTVARPLFFQFPKDKSTWTVDRQFMWGSALLISPAMDKGQTTVVAYFPKARWYNYFSGEEVQGTGTRHILDTPLDKINVHVRGGSVIPWQEPDNTTVFSRQRPMGLLIALDESQEAMGNLFWDDGESVEAITNNKYLNLEFAVDSNQLTIVVTRNDYPGANDTYFKTIDIFGLSHRPSRVSIDGKQVEPHHVTDYNGWGKGVQITNQRLYVTVPHTVVWELY